MVQLYRGSRAKYNYPENTSLIDAIYFATDTGELFVNGVNYGVDNIKLKDVAFDVDSNKLTFTKANDSTFEVNFGDKLLSAADRSAIENLKQALDGAGFTANYETTLDPDLTTVNALGGIPSGTKVSVYKDKPISRVIDDLLFPTVLPTEVAPTISLALKSGKSNIREVGSAAPIASDFTTTWNPGSIKIGNTVKSARAGEKTSESIYANTESNTVTSEAGVVANGVTNYYYKVYYATGPDPLDSKGNPASNMTALPSGSKVSSAVAVYGVYPFYANVDNDSVSKLSLTKDLSFVLKLAAEGPNKHVFKLPHTVTKIETLNTLSNQYEVYGLENFTVDTEEIEVQGNTVNYKVYTRNDAGFNGEITYRITYTK